MELEPNRQTFQFTSPVQEQIFRRLQAIGPGPAAFYRDICRIMADESPLESASHIVAHLLREIESALRDALQPIGAWQGKLTHREEIRQILRGLGIPEDDLLAQAWLSLAGKDNDYGLAVRAHRDSLAPPRPNDRDFREFVAQFDLVLGAVLSRMEARFADFFARIDQVFALPELPEARLGQLTNALPDNPIVTGYLLEQIAALGDPVWLDPLEAHGYFRHPPPVERSRDDGNGAEAVRHPHWPQSQFLAWIARDHHEDPTIASIARIALAIPETDNVAINEDLLVAALHLPPSVGSQLAPRLGRAVAAASSGFFPERVAGFIISLLQGGETDATFALARDLLQIHAEDVAPLEMGGEVLRFSPNVHGNFDDWMYERILERLAPVLIAEHEEGALNLLSDLLDDAIAKSKLAGDPGPPVDLSTHWWPALDEDDETERHLAGIRGTLLRALRESLHRLAAQDPQTYVPRLLKQLRRRTWRVYRRLELDLVRSFADDVPDLVEQVLADRNLLNIEPPLPEYQALARERFESIPAPAREHILNAIDQGLDRGLIEEAFRRNGHEPSDEEITREARRLQWERLGPIRASLPAKAQEQFDALVAEFGDPTTREARLAGATASFIGPTSPLTSAEFSEMNDGEQLTFLASWTPRGGFGSPSREGLGRVLIDAVQRDPERYSRGARSFAGLEPTYIRAVIAGLRDAKVHGATLDWESVLELCLWVVEQPQDIEGRDETGENGDPTWSWARKEIARLLAAGLSPGPSEIPFALRSQVWTVLVPLFSDPDPTPVDEARYVGPDGNSLEFGLNTVRPSAVEASIRYAAWVRRHLGEGTAVVEEWPGFTAIPEVAEALEAHFEPELDPSAAVHAAYGRFLPWLIDLDVDWVRSHLSQFFPADPDLAVLRDAAWETYVVAHTAHRQTFELILDEYRRTVTGFPNGIPRWSWQGFVDPNKRLGEHLATAYVRGWIEWDEGKGLLGEYFRLASPEGRAHVADWIGRELVGSLAHIGTEAIARLMSLWESRIAEAEAAGDTLPYRKELSAFGWWFISGRFDDAWAVEQLRRVIGLGSTPDFLYRVLGRLATLAEAMPRATVENVKLLLERENVTDWQLSASLNEIEVILTAAMSGDEAAQNLARDAANRLVARGIVAFRDLLGP